MGRLSTILLVLFVLLFVAGLAAVLAEDPPMHPGFVLLALVVVRVAYALARRAEVRRRARMAHGGATVRGRPAGALDPVAAARRETGGSPAGEPARAGRPSPETAGESTVGPGRSGPGQGER